MSAFCQELQRLRVPGAMRRRDSRDKAEVHPRWQGSVFALELLRPGGADRCIWPACSDRVVGTGGCRMGDADVQISNRRRQAEFDAEVRPVSKSWLLLLAHDTDASTLQQRLQEVAQPIVV